MSVSPMWMVEREPILSVEKGNFGKVASEDVYVAFVVQSKSDTKKTKIILHGEAASDIYEMFLTGGKTVNEVVMTNAISVDIKVLVSCVGIQTKEDKSYRYLKDCKDFRFEFDYKVEIK